MLAALVGAVVACERSASGRTERSAAARPAGDGAPSDSARGDSAALASLPPGLVPLFAVRTVLTPQALRDTASVRCERLGPPNVAESRRRLRVRLADGSRTVLFVRTARADTIRRVELVRREPQGDQRGLIWDATNDVVQSLVWSAGVRLPEVTTLPRGEPTSRALRALGRRLLALPCTGEVRIGRQRD